MDWYTIKDIDKLDTPALVVYPDRIKANISQAIAMIGEVSRLRPHVKTSKNLEVTQMMLAAGITKFKCATVAEAEMLAICSAPDVLLAYQPLGPKLERFVQLILSYPETRFSCLFDNLPAVSAMAKKAKLCKITLSVFMDLNVGQDRTGIIPGAGALRLYEQATELIHINVVGLHAYDGHIHDADLMVRTEKCNTSFLAVGKLRDEIVKRDHPEPVIIAGGSPTFPIHLKRAKVECSPGTFIYWDKGYLDAFEEQQFHPAALVVSRVVSLPNETKICLDLGHKSIAAERELKSRVFLLNAPGVQVTGQSEEHLVLESTPDHEFKEGEVIYGMPYHVCPTVALYERAITIENGYVTGEWKNIARDRKITI